MKQLSDIIGDVQSYQPKLEIEPKTNRQKMLRVENKNGEFPGYANEEWCAVRYSTDRKWHRQGIVADTAEECNRLWQERSSSR